MSSAAYNGFAGPLPDFDPKLLHFLAGRIASAIRQAISDAHRSESTLTSLRFIAAMLLVSSATALSHPSLGIVPAQEMQFLPRAERPEPLVPMALSRTVPGISQSIPTLTVLEVLRDEKQLGVLIFYAVHPTAMTHDSELYSSDLAGVAIRLLEEQGTPVAAFFNGAEGDVSPDWTLQDRDDVLRLGTRLSNSVRQLLGGGQAWPIDDPNIDVQWKGVNIDWFAPGGHPRFASAPVSGAAELGGAEDGRTIFFNYGWRGDARKTMPEGDQGTKEPALEEPLKAAFTDLDMKDVGSIVNALKPMTLFAPPSHFPTGIPDCKGSNRRLFHDRRHSRGGNHGRWGADTRPS